MGALALAVVVLAKTGSALATAVLFIATQFLPGLAGRPSSPGSSGWPPDGCFRCSTRSSAVFLRLIAVIVHRAGAPALIVLAFIDAVLAFIARTITRSASGTLLVAHDLVPEGKAAFNVALATAMIAGPALGGAAVALVGARTGLLIDAASFLCAAGMLSRATSLRGGAEPTGGAERGTLREGLRYIAGQPAIRALILGEGVAFIFFYLVVPVTVVYSARSVHAGAGGYAAILASWGAGIAVGSAVQVHMARRIGSTMILLSTGAVALAYLGTAAAPTLAVACLASVVGGVGNGTQWASVETALHLLVDEAFRARTAAVMESLAAIAPGIGILLGGALTALFSPRAAYLCAGLGLVVLVAVGTLSALGHRRAGARAGAGQLTAAGFRRRGYAGIDLGSPKCANRLRSRKNVIAEMRLVGQRDDQHAVGHARSPSCGSGK